MRCRGVQLGVCSADMNLPDGVTDLCLACSVAAPGSMPVPSGFYQGSAAHTLGCPVRVKDGGLPWQRSFPLRASAVGELFHGRQACMAQRSCSLRHALQLMSAGCIPAVCVGCSGVSSATFTRPFFVVNSHTLLNLWIIFSILPKAFLLGPRGRDCVARIDISN
jgi:hypothetical protein